MDSRNRIHVGASSSLIDLKGELLRKQKELQESKTKQKGAPKTVAKSQRKLVHRLTTEGKKNAGVDKRNLADEEEHERNEKTYEKAKSILEAKARLYDQMTSDKSILSHDRLEHHILANSLVDFQQKAIDEMKEAKKKPKSQSISDTQVYTVDDGEMVEFVDSLGRTRKCHRSELAAAIAADQELADQHKSDDESSSAGQYSSIQESFVRESNPQSSSISSSGFPTTNATALNTSLFKTEEEVTEMKHRKWNEEAAKAEEKDSVHYQDILFDEVRTHGVSYFGFSSDTQERHEQIRNLKNLSEQTKATREKVSRDRNSKASKLKERLKNIRARKRARLGLPPKESSSSESESNDPKSSESGIVREDTVREPEPHFVIDKSGSSSQETRPWDFGKPGFYGPKPVNFDELDAKWLKERREDRNKEFAPPSIYSAKAKHPKL